jgi:hypothetical protein
MTGDGFVDLRDYCVLAGQWLESGSGLAADVMEDGRVDEKDLGAFCTQWLKGCYECSSVDLNGDGKVNLRDYAVWASHYLEVGVGVTGDIDGSGIADMGDLRAMGLNWGRSCQ